MRTDMLKAVRVLDALGIELVRHNHHWSKNLRRQYGTVRRKLLRLARVNASACVADLAAPSLRPSLKRGYK
jgi:hypothetical protein